MTAPDQMPVEVTVRNATDTPIRQVRIDWVGNVGLSLTASDNVPFDLEAKGEKRIPVLARTSAEARFGITPVGATLTGQGEGGEILAMEGFGLVVAPLLGVEVDPMQSIPLPAGRFQHFFVHVDNARSSAPGGAPNKFVSHKAGPCRGVVRLDLPPGTKATPPEQPFELAADQRKTLIFKVENSQWSPEPAMVKPVILLEGQKTPACVLFPGTTILRNQEKVAPKALDDKGLLAYASCDDNDRGGRFDKSVGNPSPYFYPNHTAAYNNEGAKGWCMNSQRVCQIYDPWRNIDFFEGTALFWLRQDPSVRNENTYVPDPAATAGMGCGRSNQGETIFTAGMVQNVSSSNSGITLRRFRSWSDKDGYLQLTYQLLGRRVIVCQGGPFNWTEEWRHVALLWSVKDRRLELYLDGKLAAKADPGPEAEWYAAPWDRGRPSGWALEVITSDHGNWCGTCRDELYLYNRALSAEEIEANKNLVKPPGG